MTVSFVPTPTATAHQELTEAHQAVTRLVRFLSASLAHVSELDLPHTRRALIQIGDALHRVAQSEQACRGFSDPDHIFARTYAVMLEHHRHLYMDFERIARELTNNRSPVRSHLAALTADLERHLDAAETAHQACLRSQKTHAPVQDTGAVAEKRTKFSYL